MNIVFLLFYQMYTSLAHIYAIIFNMVYPFWIMEVQNENVKNVYEIVNKIKTGAATFFSAICAYKTIQMCSSKWA